jgi:hypothetical protein
MIPQKHVSSVLFERQIIAFALQILGITLEACQLRQSRRYIHLSSPNGLIAGLLK